TIEFIDEISKEKFKTLDKDTIEFIDEKTKVNRKTIYKKSIKNYIKKFDLESDEALIEDFIKRLIIIDKESIKEKDYKEKKIINLDIKLEEETIKFEEEFHKNYKNWKNKIEKLMREFTIRITKIKKLAKDNFQIYIAENELRVEKDLIRLFGADKYLRDSKVKKTKDIKIFDLKSLKNNDIFILTEIGIFIFHLIDDNKNLISLNYYHIHSYESDIFIGEICKMPGYPKVDDKNRKSDYDELIYGWMAYVQKDNETFLKYHLALFNYTTEVHDTELLDEIYNDYIEDIGIFLKYGSVLLMWAIKSQASNVIDKIYNKCLKLFEQDLVYNQAFLSIINESMQLLDKHYPEYIARYSSDTNMILISPKIEQLSTSHLNPFFNIGIINLTPSIAWTKYTRLVNYYSDSKYTIIRLPLKIYIAIQYVIFFLTLPISFPIFHILNNFHIINEIYDDGFSLCYYKINNKIFPKKKLMPAITFIIPYIQFACYPRDYSWWRDLIKPKPNSFVETINKEIYKTWNGEAVINFKWNKYGKYYYYTIWIFFTALLACFTAAASTNYENIASESIRNRLLIATIVLGFIHLTVEIRQIIYDPIEWVIDPWNYFVPTISSIYWLYADEKPYFWLSISCLLLDFKFLLFFRAFELFGVYFVIIVGVANKIASFLVILFIVLLSFAHAFWILLQPRKYYSLDKSPTDHDDPNNPWELTDKYNQILDNGTIVTFVQQPDKNTNMFIDYGSSLLSMYLYIIGDSNALPNWEYLDNPQLTILIVLFSLLIVVYLMNLLIGLLSNAIDEDNNRVSYLVQKAKILAEIELFYLSPGQRRWKSWFPDVMHYHAAVKETRREIQKLKKEGEWSTDKFSIIKEDLLKML
ncbi:8315_t:CDS:2, partial [Funneliformis geosporum]